MYLNYRQLQPFKVRAIMAFDSYITVRVKEEVSREKLERDVPQWKMILLNCFTIFVLVCFTKENEVLFTCHCCVSFELY